MKYLPLLLGITIGFAAPLTVHAEQPATAADTTTTQAKTKKKTKVERVVVTTTAPAPAKKPDRVRYEMTNMTVAGSHIPVVLYHYKGEAYAGGNSFAPRKAYRRENGGLDTTGSANVAGELVSLDPAFH